VHIAGGKTPEPAEVYVPTFPSTEWIDAFCVELASHPRAAHAAASLGGVYRFIVDPSGPLPDRRQYHVSLSAADGDVQVARVGDADRARITVRTDYDRWQQILLGQLDLGSAMLFGRVQISGDLAGLLGAQQDVAVVVEALQAVDTVWLEQTSG
jgi:hypothetical protein